MTTDQPTPGVLTEPQQQAIRDAARGFDAILTELGQQTDAAVRTFADGLRERYAPLAEAVRALAPPAPVLPPIPEPGYYLDRSGHAVEIDKRGDMRYFGDETWMLWDHGHREGPFTPLRPATDVVDARELTEALREGAEAWHGEFCTGPFETCPRCASDVALLARAEGATARPRGRAAHGHEGDTVTRHHYLHAPAYRTLDRACVEIRRAFGTPYLVGSATQRPDHRDVDVRVIIDDADFLQMFPGRADAKARMESNARWSLPCSLVSDHLSKVTGLPIDFQIQSMTQANTDSNKTNRIPLGVVPVLDDPAPTEES